MDKYELKEALQSDEFKELNEAFAKGTAAKVVPKIASLVAKRGGKSLSGFSPIPQTYTTKDGLYEGYLVMLEGGKEAIRINFLKGKSDAVDTVDFFFRPGVKPDLTLHLEGAFIGQVINGIADVLKGKRGVDDEAEFREARTSPQKVGIQTWLEHPDVSSFITEADYDFMKNHYINFCNDNNHPSFGNDAPIKWTIRNYLKTNRLTNSYMSGRVTQSPEPVYQQAPETTQAVQEYYQIEKEYLLKYEMIEAYTRQMASGAKHPTALFVYGIGGIGKTFGIRKIFKEFGLWDEANDSKKVLYRKGNISGYTGLVQLLWRFKDGRIIMLDDNDSILDNNTAANILKGALDTTEPRMISITKASSGRQESAEGQESLQEEDQFEIDLAANGMNFTPPEAGPDSMLNTENSGPIPEKFEITSKVIFISNKTKIPPAVGDRCVSIELNLTKAEVAELIESKLEHLMPDEPFATMEIKKEVLEFMKRYMHQAKKMSFRQFEFCISARKAADEAGGNWKDWVISTMKSGVAPNFGR
jgi:hypothetical protein